MNFCQNCEIANNLAFYNVVLEWVLGRKYWAVCVLELGRPLANYAGDRIPLVFDDEVEVLLVTF